MLCSSPLLDISALIDDSIWRIFSVAAPYERRAGVGQRHALPGTLHRPPRPAHRQGSTGLIQYVALGRITGFWIGWVRFDLIWLVDWLYVWWWIVWGVGVAVRRTQFLCCSWCGRCCEWQGLQDPICKWSMQTFLCVMQFWFSSVWMRCRDHSWYPSVVWIVIRKLDILNCCKDTS